MRALLQRVRQARVSVHDEVVGAIGSGWTILVSVAPHDTAETSRVLAEKIAHLRCFEDESGKMNRSALDVRAEMLVISQFTLHADTTRGRRPSFVRAAPPGLAESLVTGFADDLRNLGFRVETGRFGAHMLVSIDNDGPVTIWLDTDEKRAG